MTRPTNEIGSGMSPHAAEVEPPATRSSVTAGGSTKSPIDFVPNARALVERLRPWSQYSFAEMHQGPARQLFAQAADVIESLIGYVPRVAPAAPAGDMNDHMEAIDKSRPRQPATVAKLASETGMGVTANAILLLGNVTSHIIGAPDRLYEVEQIDAGAGILRVRRRGTENIHRISIVQLEGTERTRRLTSSSTKN